MQISETSPRPVRQIPQQHGVLVLDKPAGPTSTACLSRIKRLGQKKIGHAGTLDPMASGVLLVLLGKATKLSGYLLQGGSKVYQASVQLGRETSTWDDEGETLAELPREEVLARVCAEDVQSILASWQGELEQIVPPYSAAKSNGQPLYRLARAGREVPVKIKTVTIFQTELLQLDLPFVHFRVRCSSGTYIRSLAHSLGKRLGCGATLVKLVREYSHPFALTSAVGLDELLQNPDLLAAHVQPIDKALPDWPVLDVDEGVARQIRNGMPVPCPGELAGKEQVVLRCLDEVLALGRIEDGKIVVARGLWS